MKMYDISVPIRPGMIVYEGNPAVHLERMDSIANGAHANVSRLDLGVHTGTHVDAPVQSQPFSVGLTNPYELSRLSAQRPDVKGGSCGSGRIGNALLRRPQSGKETPCDLF